MLIGPLGLKVSDSRLQDRGRVFEQAEASIAVMAEESTHFPRCVVVIHTGGWHGIPADVTAALLRFHQALEDAVGDAVDALAVVCRVAFTAVRTKSVPLSDVFVEGIPWLFLSALDALH
jgi:hypothetical protein